MLVLSDFRQLIPGIELGFAKGQAQAFFRECLADVHTQPDLVIYATTGEGKLLRQPGVANIVKSSIALFPNARHELVSLGCLGLHAALLHAHHVAARSVLILIVEVSLEYGQSEMDQNGLGTDGDEMIGQEGIGFLRLERKKPAELAPDDIVIEECCILAKPNGMVGLRKLVQKVTRLLEYHVADIRHMVSFRLGSRWASQLLDAFERIIRPRLPAFEVLPSSEQDQLHRLSMKPVVELAQYLEVLQCHGKLAISSLGAGGRFGLIKVRLGSAAAGPAWTGNPQPAVRQSVVFDGVEFHPPAESAYLVFDPDYLVVDDTYFAWPITLAAQRREAVPRQETILAV